MPARLESWVRCPISHLRGAQRLTSKCCRKRAEIPIYSFEKHARLDKTTTIYSPHVLIVEGIFALYDPRVLELLDMKVRCPVASLEKCLQLWPGPALMACRSFAKPMLIPVSRDEYCEMSSAEAEV